MRVVFGAAARSLETGVEPLGGLLRTAFSGRAMPHLDPNHWQTQRQGGEGLARIPCSITPTGERSSPRARLLAVKKDANHGRRLHLLTGVCVTGIEFAEEAREECVGGIDTKLRAVGIRCLPESERYEAAANHVPTAAGWKDRLVRLYCKREVILCGGSFNTPQLLMLSGVGPKDHLKKHGIDVKRELSGVGQNLQDRYEVPVAATVTSAFRTFTGLGLTSHGDVAKDDPHLKQWADNAGQSAARRGLYATNGGLVAIVKRSGQEDSFPDLFIFALAGYFPGYHVGYSKPAEFFGLPPGTSDKDAAAAPKRVCTWILLKARTRHHGGYVELRSDSPFRRPDINFRSFPGDPDPDVEALTEGVEFVRSFLERGREDGAIERHWCPNLDEKFGGDVRTWVRNIAWGHHACGTCRIGGDDDERAVLDSRFRVRGVKGLRVVDASVFPRIPGFFIVANVYTVSEKAADVLTEDHPRPADSLPPECREALRLDPVLRSRAEFEARRQYPAELEAAEAALIRQRREKAGL